MDARDGTQVWGERYDRKATDMLAAQSAISREITERLRLRLTTSQQARLSAGENVHPEANALSVFPIKPVNCDSIEPL